jgi:hypothetical protein
MNKNRFNVSDDCKSVSCLYSLRIKANDNQLFRYDLRRQNVFGQNLRTAKVRF